MADTTRAKKGSKKDSVQVSRSKTVAHAKKLALAVIREYGLPKEIEEDLLRAGVAQDVIDRIGGRQFSDPWFYKPKKQ